MGAKQRYVLLRLHLAVQGRGLDVFAVQHEGVVVLGRCGVGRGVDLEVSGELGHVVGRAGNGRRGGCSGGSRRSEVSFFQAFLVVKISDKTATFVSW